MLLKTINNIIIIIFVFSSCSDSRKESNFSSPMYYHFPTSTIKIIDSLIEDRDVIGASINYDYHQGETDLFIFFNRKNDKELKLFDDSYEKLTRFKGDRFIKTKSLNIPIFSNEEVMYIEKVGKMFEPINSQQYIILELNSKGFVKFSGIME
jgi:hypothetical protein